MIPRAEIICVEHKITASRLRKRFVETKLTRIPVYQDTLNNILGFVHVKDFLSTPNGKADFDIKQILRPVIYVPGTQKCTELFKKMKTDGINLIVVLDEYGVVEGLVTVDRLVEGILGDISDEHDAQQNHVSPDDYEKLGDGSYIMDARMPIRLLQKDFGPLDFLSEEDGEYDTLGGFVLAYLGRVPEVGEKFHHKEGIRIEILEANPRKVIKLKVNFGDE